jgi:hypothetical protein
LPIEPAILRNCGWQRDGEFHPHRKGLASLKEILAAVRMVRVDVIVDVTGGHPMGRPPLGTQPMTKTERQRRWRQRKRLAQAADPSHQLAATEPKSTNKSTKPDSFVIRPTPATDGDQGKYTAIIAQVLEFVDGLSQSQSHLLEVI